MVLGRDESNDVVLRDPAVSRVHARIERRGERWFLRDLDSSNGTFLNGRRVSVERAVFRDDELRLGNTVIVFRAGPPSDETRELTMAPAVTEHANVFRREGDYWSLSYAATTVRVKDAKGLRDIARLLANPGTEISTVDLLDFPAPVGTGIAQRPAEHGLSRETSVGDVLDYEARQQYRARLQELESESHEAEANNDLERVSRAAEERSFLLAELGSAVGLGGRVRTALDPAERARKAVTWRIRGSISRIETSHRELGQHLRRSVRTGAFCVYDPPEREDWQL